jgi:hypothetical protein
MQRALAVHIVKQGLQSGLTRFFGRATRAALIYSSSPGNPNDFIVYDTMGLLANHKDQIQNYFRNTDAVPYKNRIQSVSDVVTRTPQIDEGLYTFIHQSKDVFFHMWFVERPQTDSPSSLLEQWLRFAQLPLLRPDQEMNFGTQIGSGRLAEHAAYDVVREVLMGEMFPRTLEGGDADAELVLDSLIEIASVKEEGSGCTGTLAVFDRNPDQQPKLDYALRNQVHINKFKHVRKLLTATNSDYHLVSICGDIVGFSHKDSLTAPLSAVFERGHLSLFLQGMPLCQAANGVLKAIETKWSLDVQKQTRSLSALEEPLKTQIQELVNELVTTARRNHFGFTLLLALRVYDV